MALTADDHASRGAGLAVMNRWDEALADFDQAIALCPDHIGAHFSRAIIWLLLGDFARGWSEFEWRWKTPHGRALLASKALAKPVWLGAEDIAGKTILLYSEIGLGDTLQFCRYAKAVHDLGASVILQVQAPLVELLRQLDGVSQVIADTDSQPPFDLHCPLLSLPLALKIELATIPSGKYLCAPAARAADRRARIGRSTKPRVGLVWRGDPGNPDNGKRSMSMNDLLPHLPVGFHYFSLQKQLSESEQSLAVRYGVEYESDLNFVETAAVCDCLDLVISVDTSIAHLSAALGGKTWILLPYNPDPRWLLDRVDSPWYASVRLYRQGRSGDWRGVLAEVGADLTREFARPTATY
jgi:hypothetical protein